MKFIIIGLGNFGTSLAERLSKSGHEVIGVDRNIGKVEAIKERITHSICVNSTDPQAVMSLPLSLADVVIVAIGEDEGANIMTTALMKQMKVKRLIGRAVTALHQTVLEAMGVDEIIHPEEEAADHWAKKLTNKSFIESFDLTSNTSIIELKTPDKCVGKTLAELSLSNKYNIIVLTTLRASKETNVIGISKSVLKSEGIANAQTFLEKGDIMVLYGNPKDIQRFLSDNRG
jgi:trk system potassium uptake protein TrkA